MERKIKLERLVDYGVRNEKKYVQLLIEKNELWKKIRYINFWKACYPQWLYAYFEEKNIKKAKQFMYTAGKIVNLMKESHTSEMCLGPYEKLTTLLLSDSNELIELFTKWDYEDIYFQKKVIGFSPIIQQLLKNNKKAATRELKKYYEYEYTFSTSFKAFGGSSLYQNDSTLMKDLIDGNKSGIKKGLKYLVEEEVHRNRLYGKEFASNFLSFPAVAILKTAWILGYEIEVDSPYIPMELMPIQPLEKYEVPYFFMDGYEGEIPESYLKWKKAEALGLNEITTKNKTEFKWDKTKYNSLQEAIIIENALAKGFRVEKDRLGNVNIYNEIGKNIASWVEGKGWN